MDIGQRYLERYAYAETLFSAPPEKDLNLIVVIPCFNEINLMGSLLALNDCHSTKNSCEIIVIINDGEHHNNEIKKQNLNTYEEAMVWAQSNNKPKRKFLIHYASNISPKQAGVGMARKIGMDEASRRLLKVNNMGIIVGFDADSLCLPNYLKSIENHFANNIKSPGASIRFEHPLQGPLNDKNYEGIMYYELYLRYYTNALRFTRFPFAFHTIGSSMAVRSEAYMKQGGMNKRKAGEDFYFLQKIIPIGYYTEINDTKVIPSSRASDRVPFGTGRAIEDWLNQNKKLSEFYHPAIFQDLQKFIAVIPRFFKANLQQQQALLYGMPDSIRSFLAENNFWEELKSITSHCGPTIIGFKKRFFQWFDAFRILKYVHFARDHHHKNVTAEDAIKWLFKNYYKQESRELRLKEALVKMRELDKLGWQEANTFIDNSISNSS